METHEGLLGSWNKFLNPAILKSNLIKISVYMCAYELLSESIIDQVKGFYVRGFDGKKSIVDNEYTERFKGKSPLNESLEWLIENSVISHEDKQIAIELKNYRNELAHEMKKYIGTTTKEVKDEYFDALYALVAKIDIWWIKNVEMDIDEDFQGKEIKDEEITSGSMFMLQLLYQVYAGKDDELERIYRGFSSIFSNKKT